MPWAGGLSRWTHEVVLARFDSLANGAVCGRDKSKR